MKKAVIFDMDGVLVDTEGFWKIAEEDVFSSLGVKLDPQSCELTKTMTTKEVTNFWYSKYPWSGVEHEEVEQMVVEQVKKLISVEDCEITGVRQFINELKKERFKIGLATNSPFEIIPNVTSKLEIAHLLDCTVSSEHELSGKPQPDVYLSALSKLGIEAKDSIAIEDSKSGIMAAKNAGMVVVGFTNNGKNKNLENADYLIDEYSQIDWAILNN